MYKENLARIYKNQNLKKKETKMYYNLLVLFCALNFFTVYIYIVYFGNNLDILESFVIHHFLEH